MPRIARVVVVGVPHHVTQRGNGRCRTFFEDKDCRFYLWTLLKYCQRYGLQVWAYCLMDNHVHVLAVPEREDSLARCFGGTNLVYTQYVNRERNRSGRLWQNRFFSCPVEREEYLWSVLRYIERNPVRARVVGKPWDYAWSSARHHVLEEPDPIINEPGWLTAELREGYRTYLRRDSLEDTDRIRRATASGRPLGQPAFLARLESKLGRNLKPGRPGRPRKRRG